MTEAVRGRAPSSAEWLSVAAITLVAAAVLTSRISWEGLTSDEAYSYALSQRAFADMLSLFGFEANGAIYSVVLWPLSRIDASESTLRSPAVVAGVAAVPALWWAGREIATRSVGLLAASLLAVSPYAVYYAKIARPYSMVILFSALSAAALAWALRSERRLPWVFYVVFLVLLGYANAMSPLYVLPAHGLLVLYTGRGAWRAWATSLAGAAVLWAPLFVGIAIERSRRDTLYFLTPPSLSDFEFAAWRFGVGVWDAPSVVPYVPVLVAITLAAFVMLTRGRERRGRYAVVLTWAVGPAVIAALVSYLATPVFSPKYIAAGLPGFVLLLALGLSDVPRPVAVAAASAVLVLFAAGTVWQSTHRVRADFKGAVRHYAHERRPSDTLLVDGIPVLPGLGYYDADLRASDGALVVEEWEDRDLPPHVLGLDDPGGYSDPPAGPPTPDLISEHASRDRRLIVVLAEWSERLQGDVLHDAGIGWARTACTVKHARFRLVDVLVIADCPS